MTRPQNGKVPASALATVQTGTYRGRAYSIKLERATAAAYKKAEADGHLTIDPPLGGDRTLTDQEHLKADPAEYGSNLKPSQIGAAGNSTHGWGDCVDIATNNAWFAAHCHEYGFVRESPAGETNHYRYLHPTWATTSTASVGDETAVPTPETGDTMKIAIIEVSAGKVEGRILFGDGTYGPALSTVELAAWRGNQPKNHGPLGLEYTLTHTGWSRLVAGGKLTPRK